MSNHSSRKLEQITQNENEKEDYEDNVIIDLNLDLNTTTTLLQKNKEIDQKEEEIKEKKKKKKKKKKDNNKEVDKKEVDKKEVDKKEVDNKEITFNFDLDSQTIDELTKDIEYNKFFRKNQIKKYNDLTIVAMLLKFKVIEKYKCCSCRITHLHNRKPITLLINFLNGNENDFSHNNFELICPNCYFQKYGINLIKNKIKNNTFNCKFCKYPILKGSVGLRNKKICFICNKKIKDNKFDHFLDDLETETEEKFNESRNISLSQSSKLKFNENQFDLNLNRKENNTENKYMIHSKHNHDMDKNDKIKNDIIKDNTLNIELNLNHNLSMNDFDE